MILAELVLPIPGGPEISTAFFGASFAFAPAVSACSLRKVRISWWFLTPFALHPVRCDVPVPLPQPDSQVGDQLPVAYQLRHTRGLVLLHPQLVGVCKQVRKRNRVRDEAHLLAAGEPPRRPARLERVAAAQTLLA